ncbi:MAG: 3-phosphoshikimate 1-carboxyvinyltransferase, partial [Deltaproteobacteria bacterium]|nr:3-phosphoshikimate 1-carboxyvinyltransferase [Deltaproteobacteria bacterium]
KGAGLGISGPLSNHADLSFDLQDVPDMVPALAIVCAFRQGKSILRHIAHLRVKESDRVAALANELKKLGVRVEEKQDRMTIQGPPVRGANISCYDDHRIAMSFAVAGLGIDGVVITDPDCVRKSFPNFWQTLASLGSEQP